MAERKWQGLRVALCLFGAHCCSPPQSSNCGIMQSCMLHYCVSKERRRLTRLSLAARRALRAPRASARRARWAARALRGQLVARALMASQAARAWCVQRVSFGGSVEQLAALCRTVSCLQRLPACVAHQAFVPCCASVGARKARGHCCLVEGRGVLLDDSKIVLSQIATAKASTNLRAGRPDRLCGQRRHGRSGSKRRDGRQRHRRH